MSEGERDRKRRLKEGRQIRAHQHFSDDLKHVYLMKSCLRNSSKLCSSFKQNMIQRSQGKNRNGTSLKKGVQKDAAHVGESLGQVKF